MRSVARLFTSPPLRPRRFPLPAAAPTDVASFLACLRQSGLMTKVQIAEFMEGRDAATPKDVASDLVAARHLTRWQAEKLLAGRCRGFRLGSYALLGLLGKGGMSAVYLGEHVVMKRRCAIKVLPAKLVGGGSHLERFMREARAVAALDHPNIVRAYDVASEGEGNSATHFLVMELVEGRSLYDLVKRDGPPPPDRVRQIGHEAAKGLAHAHAAGIVHRDVKPGNILLAKTGAVKVTDLGLARGGEDEEHSLTVAHDEKVLGTADYLAPEQALDSHTVDHRADIYGLGCTLYFSLCGHGPFTEGTLTQRLMAHQTQPPKPIESLVEGVPPELAAAIGKMLEKKREDRFQTMDEVAEALAPSSAGEAAAAEGGPPPEPELSDFLAGLPAETGSEARSGSRSGIRQRTPVKPKSSVIRGRNGAAAPSAEPPSSKTNRPVEPGSGSGRFAFLGDADVPEEISSGARSGGPGSGAGAPSGFDLDSNAAGGSGVDVGSGAGAGATRSGARSAARDAGSGRQPNVADAPSPPPRSRRADHEDRPKSVWPWIAAGGLVLLLIVGLGAWLMSGGGGEEPVPEDELDGPEAEVVAELGGPLTVGPDGRFKTLAEALDYLRAANYDSRGSDASAVVQLPAGTLNERLIADGTGFDFPSNVTVRGATAGTTLRSSGEEPTVLVTGPLTGFALENVTVDAAGREVGIELTGVLSSSRLSGVTVENVGGTGLLLSGASSDALVLKDLTITGGGNGQRGVAFTSGKAANVTLEGGAITGMATGVEIAADAEQVTLDGIIIGPGEVGVQFGGNRKEVTLEQVALQDVKFAGVDRGVVFGSPPKKPSGNSKDFLLRIAGTDFGDAGTPIDVGDYLGKVKSVLDAETSKGNAAANPGDDPLNLFP